MIINAEHPGRGFGIALSCKLNPAFVSHRDEERGEFVSSVSAFALRPFYNKTSKKKKKQISFNTAGIYSINVIVSFRFSFLDIMTTTESSLLTPSLFNIQYPNCRRGMFSLREPFKNVPTENIPTEQRQESARRATPPVEEPNNLNTNPG